MKSCNLLALRGSKTACWRSLAFQPLPPLASKYYASPLAAVRCCARRNLFLHFDGIFSTPNFERAHTLHMRAESRTQRVL